MILLFMLQIQHYCFMGQSTVYWWILARETTTALIAYCGNPQSPPEMCSAFAKKLTSSLSCCFVSKRTIKLKKEGHQTQFVPIGLSLSRSLYAEDHPLVHFSGAC